MNTAQRMLPYARQYVIIAIYEILEHDGVPYKKRTRQQSYSMEIKASFLFL